MGKSLWLGKLYLRFQGQYNLRTEKWDSGIRSMVRVCWYKTNERWMQWTLGVKLDNSYYCSPVLYTIGFLFQKYFKSTISFYYYRLLLLKLFKHSLSAISIINYDRTTRIGRLYLFDKNREHAAIKNNKGRMRFNL